MRVYLTGIAALVLIYVFGIGYPLVQLIAAGLLAIVAIPAWLLMRDNAVDTSIEAALQTFYAERASRRALPASEPHTPANETVLSDHSEVPQTEQ